jgi:Arc-like DNA binding domain
MAKRKKTAIVQTGLRMREGLRADLEKAAKARGISLNAEIADRLERSVDRVGLLEEVLALAYGPQWGAFLAEAHRHGILTFRDQDKATILSCLAKFIDALPKKPEAKS